MDQTDRMEHFERRLTRLMQDAGEHNAFEARHQERLRAGVLARRRVRAARRAAGSVLAVAGLGLGLFLWPSAPGTDRPSAPPPRPAVSPTPTPSTTPSAGVSPSTPPTSASSTMPADPGGATETSVPPTGTATTHGAHGGTATTPPPTRSAHPPGEASSTPSSTPSSTSGAAG